MDIKTALSRIVGHLDLSTAEMSDVMREIMTGQCTDAQIGAFMMAMRMKSESIDEIVGAVSVMRELADKVELKTLACSRHWPGHRRSGLPPAAPIRRLAATPLPSAVCRR